MGERKVVNKYYPPDFDPSRIPRRRKSTQQKQMKVTMMLPMTVRCKSCGNYIYQGTKFNCRMEDVVGDTYLGIKKHRFYFKCTNCGAEIVVATDPQNDGGYVVEAGATTRGGGGGGGPWVDQVAAAAQGDDDDGMKTVENRMLQSKREVDMLASVDELRCLKARRGDVSVDDVLAAMHRSGEAEKARKRDDGVEDEDEDEALIKSIFRVRRIDDDNDDEGKEEKNDGVKRRKLGCEVASEPPTVKFNVTKKPVDCVRLLCQYEDDDD